MPGNDMRTQRCDYCGRDVTPEEQALEWPIDTENGDMCPSCYGDEAFCRCGAVLPATDDVEECDECRALAEEIRRAEDLWTALSEAGRERPIGEEGDSIAQAAAREGYTITRAYSWYLALAERGDELVLISSPGRPHAVSLNLRGANLHGARLAGVNLRAVDLCGADLSEADLRRADLSCADLTGADLRGARLTHADLTGVRLTGATAISADLSGALLVGADLSGANLSKADLKGANLSFADLRGTDFTGADMRGAVMSGAVTE